MMRQPLRRDRIHDQTNKQPISDQAVDNLNARHTTLRDGTAIKALSEFGPDDTNRFGRLHHEVIDGKSYVHKDFFGLVNHPLLHFLVDFVFHDHNLFGLGFKKPATK